MNKLLLFTIVLVLLLLSIASAKKTKKSSSKKFRNNNADACACDSTFKPVCDLSTHTTYPSACLAKCMGVVSSLKKGSCPVRVKKVVKNVCKKNAKGKKFDVLTAQLMRELIERTKRVESNLASIQNRVGKVESLKGVEAEIKNIVSQIPATAAPVKPIAPTAAPLATAAPTALIPTAAPIKPPQPKTVGTKGTKKGGKKGTKKGTTKKNKKGSAKPKKGGKKKTN